MNIKTSHILITMGLIVLLSTGYILIFEKQSNNFPTEGEWLEVYTNHIINQSIGVWETRYHSSVWVDEHTHVITITITSANGEEPISDPGYVKQWVTSSMEAALTENSRYQQYQLNIQVL